jgi:hypothetical protein
MDDCPSTAIAASTLYTLRGPTAEDRVAAKPLYRAMGANEAAPST